MKHTITILVENEFGVLTRVAGLFSARGYNIESLNVAPTLDESISRMTLVTRGDERVIEQIKKQLNKLIPVIKTEDISHVVHVEREMILVKMKPDLDIGKVVYNNLAKVIDDSGKGYRILEFSGTPDEIKSFVKQLVTIQPFR
ncbi:MAG: acetolactate synthase small subunit [Zetaproteobacteria bacterium CG02_land_8_20_14_3_00_50_9]|nr:MAG: acetolactate synthase small subunit [Zetaproteobacteria bacterium CG02_land_8_20_14_3_00_50_9]